MRHRKIKNVILDFDGVIVDTYELVFDIFKERYPQVTRENFQDLFDTSVNEKDEMGLADGEDFVDWFFSKYNSALSGQHTFPASEECLRELAEDYNLFLVTSNSEKVVGEFLRDIDLNLFTEIMGYETDRLKVEKFKLLEERDLINQEDSVFVTDTLADVVEGKEAGYKVIAGTFGYHDRNRLKKGQPDVIADSWREIVKLINCWSD